MTAAALPTQAEYLTAEQVSQMTGFSLKALETMRHRRNGPAFLRVGIRGVRYRVCDVRAWIEQGGTA